VRRRKNFWGRLRSGLYVPTLLSFAPGYPCCTGGPVPGNDCDFCDGLTAPAEILLELENWANTIACTDCVDINGSHVLPQELCSGGDCCWRKASGTCAGTLSLQLLWTFELRLSFASGTQASIFCEAAPDCMAWDHAAMTVTYPTGGACGNPAGTEAAYVTSL